ncbi:NAD(P)/FAD-dependent oxidoreductase [bacterium]|nr:NAD(P)/FAD-dependent oxidoreductase [bacterium]
MNPQVIIGGGLSGLLTARILQEKNISWIGFEKTSRLGGRAESGPHRVLRSETAVLFQELVPEIKWLATEGDVKERVKGEFEELHEGFSEAEKFYLTSSLYAAETPFENFVEKLAASVTPQYQTRKTVTRIRGSEKVIEFSDGSEQNYQQLFWCSDLGLLFKVWEGEPLCSPKSMKKQMEKPAGVNLTLELESPLADIKNTVVLPFRFKDWKLRGLGIPELHRLHWMVFLPKELMEDREEVAKCVRSLKRELLKEFPELSTKIKKEKIVYLPVLSGEDTAQWSSLNIAPDVFYIGPQIYTLPEQAELKNLDLVAAQAQQLRTQNLAL